MKYSILIALMINLVHSYEIKEILPGETEMADRIRDAIVRTSTNRPHEPGKANPTDGTNKKKKKDINWPAWMAKSYKAN